MFGNYALFRKKFKKCLNFFKNLTKMDNFGTKFENLGALQCKWARKTESRGHKFFVQPFLEPMGLSGSVSEMKVSNWPLIGFLNILSLWLKFMHSVHVYPVHSVQYTYAEKVSYKIYTKQKPPEILNKQLYKIL